MNIAIGRSAAVRVWALLLHANWWLHFTVLMNVLLNWTVDDPDFVITFSCIFKTQLRNNGIVSPTGGKLWGRPPSSSSSEHAGHSNLFNSFCSSCTHRSEHRFRRCSSSTSQPMSIKLSQFHLQHSNYLLGLFLDFCNSAKWQASLHCLCRMLPAEEVPHGWREATSCLSPVLPGLWHEEMREATSECLLGAVLKWSAWHVLFGTRLTVKSDNARSVNKYEVLYCALT